MSIGVVAQKPRDLQGGYGASINNEMGMTQRCTFHYVCQMQKEDYLLRMGWKGAEI